MSKATVAALFTGAILLSACQPKGAPASPPLPARPPKAAFAISPLAETDYSGIQGCTTVFRPAGTQPGSNIFVEDAVDTDAKGLMKVDGEMVGVKLVSETQSGKGGLRLFRSADGKLSVAENYITGAAHEDTDSVEMTGNLTITWKGASQSIKVEGGTAC